MVEWFLENDKLFHPMPHHYGCTDDHEELAAWCHIMRQKSKKRKRESL